MQFKNSVAFALLPLLGVEGFILERDASATASASASAGTSGLGDFGVCLPKGSDGKPDPKAPCRMVEQISADCGQTSQIDPKKQQKCLCSSASSGSAYWDNIVGCLNCARLHGIDNIAGQKWFPEQAVPQLSSSYCGVVVATAPFESYLDKFTKEAAFSTINPGSLTVTDVLGTSTAVSLYFTASAQPTGGAASGSSNGTASAGASNTSGAASTTAPASGTTGGVVASQSTSGGASTTAANSASSTSSGNGAAAVTMGAAGGALAFGVLGAAMLL